MKKIVCVLLITLMIGVSGCGIGKLFSGNTASLTENAQAKEDPETSGNDVSGEDTKRIVEIQEGVYADYVLMPENGEIKRYKLWSSELGDIDLSCVTDDRLLYKWGQGDKWRFYEMKEYPEREKILGLGPGGGIYEEYPFIGVDESKIEAVKQSEAVLLINGSVESGKELWKDFYIKACNHIPASIIIGYCYTQLENVSYELKIAEAGDYPCLFLRKLTYDGTEFVYEVAEMIDGEYMTTDTKKDGLPAYYKYLRHFEGEARFPFMTYSYYNKYILTDNNTADLYEIEDSGMVDPSQNIKYIEVYGEYTWKE